MNDIQKMVLELLDRETIRQLPIAYCHYVRTRNIPAMLDLFTDDAEFDVDKKLFPDGIGRGRDALVKAWTEGIEKLDPWPFIHNHLVEFTGRDSATGYVHAEFRMGNMNYRVTSIGIYTDKYVRLASGEWKFRSRSLSAKLLE